MICEAAVMPDANVELQEFRRVYLITTMNIHPLGLVRHATQYVMKLFLRAKMGISDEFASRIHVFIKIYCESHLNDQN